MNRYIIAILVTSLAIVVRWLLNPILDSQVPFTTLFGAVAASVWIGGYRSAIVAIIGGYLVANYLFIEPRYAFAVDGGTDVVGLITYLASCGIIVAFGEALDRSRLGVAEQSERLRTTLASIGDAVITTDTAGLVTNMNAVAEALTGWRNAEAIGRPMEIVFKIVNEETRIVVENPAIRALREGVIVGLANHTTLIAKDSTERPIDDSAAPIRCKDGEIVGCVLVFRDITDRKLAEVRLKAREEWKGFLLKLSDTQRAESDAAVLEADAVRLVADYLQVDRSFTCRLSPDEKLGVIECEFNRAEQNSLRGEYKFEDFPNTIRRLEEEPLVIHDLANDPNYSAQDKNSIGAMGMSALLAAPIRKGKRNLVWALVVGCRAPRYWSSDELQFVEEIAERTWVAVERAKAEAALRASENRFRSLFESMDEGFCVIEMVFDSAGRTTDFSIVEMNPAFERHSGMSNLLGKSMRQSIPELEEFWYETYGHVAMTGEPIRFVSQASPMGDRWFEVYAFPLCEDETKKVAILFTDISKRRKSEEALRDADRRKDEFLATLAHELRNPLAPLRNGLEIMKLAKDDVQEMEKLLPLMERQVSQMAHLIDDLMDLSRISRGKIALQRKRLQVGDAIRDAIEISRCLIESQNHELLVDMPTEALYIEADPTRLAQVLSNLLNNAAKYTNPGGRIRLSAQLQEGEVVLTVEDNGIGIPKPMLPKIFEMFTQVDRSLEKSNGGLGIGLNIVQRLVEMHGGNVIAMSDGDGAGSRFIVRLPVAEDPVDRESNLDHNLATPAARCRILVVDDNVDGADTLAKMLSVLGNETLTAHDGLEAVAKAESFRPDVILMDIGMPRLNGYEACQRIRAQSWGSHIIIVAQTGWGQDDDKLRSQEAGFNHHMVKPIDPAALQKFLNESPMSNT